MSAGIARRFGPYLHAEGFSREKVFVGGRAFQVLISGAYDAGGLIGPEKNGIAIFDKDNRAVVLTDHFRISSGYYGPSEEQVKEFERIMKMEWPDFAAFCRSNAAYRGQSPDINRLSTKPDRMDRLQQAIADNKPVAARSRKAKNILTEHMKAANKDPKVPYKFPCADRENIIVFLANHHHYHPMNSWNGGYMLAWNIKVHGNVDYTGKNHGRTTGYQFNDEFDERWAEYVEEHSADIFGAACENALRHYTEGSWTPYPGNEEGYTFYTNGRSGGHLVLQDWPGPTPKGWGVAKMVFDGRDHFIEWLKSLSDQDLAKLYGAVVTLDHDLKDPHIGVTYEIAFLRHSQEEVWADELHISSEAAPGSSSAFGM